MADNEHRVLKNNTFDEWRQKSNEVSFDVGDNALLDNTRLSDKVFNYTASAGQVHVKGNDTNGDTLVIQKLPDSFLDNTGGYIILEHGTTIPGAFAKDAVLTQGSAYSATISSVVTVDNKSKILVKNSTGTFSTSTDLTVGSSTIAHAKVERLVSESFPKGNIRVKKAGVELTQDLNEAGFHIANHAGTINLTGTPTVDKVTEGITVYQASANQTTQSGVEGSADWWGTVLHANTTEIKVKSNNGTFNSGSNDDIRILGYAPNTAKVDAANVSSFTVNDSSTLHTVELNNEASGSDAIVIITTDLVSAINELQDDIGTIESLDASLGTDVVTALNNIEAVFDASTHEISAGSNTFTINSDNFTVNSNGTIKLDAEDGIINLFDNTTQYGSLTNSGGNLVIKSGTTTMLTGSGANATFAGNISLPYNGKVILGGSNELQIFNDNTNSVISSTDNLHVRTNVFRLNKADNSENMITTDGDGAVHLFHNGNSKLSTKTDGVDITGELQSDSLDVDGAGDISGNLAVGGNTTVGGNETITGNLTVNGTTVDINANAEVSGTTTLSSTLSVSGTATLVGAATVGTTLGVTGVATFATHASVGGNFSVNGNSTLGNDANDDTGISGDLSVAGTLGVTGNVSVGSLTTTSQHVKGAINELQSEIGSAVFTGDITDGAGSVTAAIGLIETEIGDDEAYNVGGSITYGGSTISAALVSLNNGMKTNDTDITTLQDRNINTVDSGSGLSGGGNLSADRSLSVVVDGSSIEIPTTGSASIKNKLRVKQGGITNAMLAGLIANGKLSNSAVSINSQSISLGGSHTFNSDDFAEGGSNKYYTDERVDDRVNALIVGGNGITTTYEDDDQNPADSLTLALDPTVAGAGLTHSSGVLAVGETGNSGITVNANDIAVDDTVLRTNVNRTIANDTTLTVLGTLNLSSASVTFPSQAGSVFNIGTSFLTITAGQAEQGLKIDRSAINNSHTIDPAIQWDNAKASDVGWEVVYPNPADNAELSSSLVTFANAGQLVDGSTETGISVTHSSDNFNFAVQVDDSSIEVNSTSNNLQVKASGITNGMLAGSIANNKLTHSTISGKALGTNLSTLTGGTGVTLTDGYNGSSAKTISIGQPVGTGDSPTFNDLTVSGNLYVQGDNTILTTSTLSVEDKNITLNYGTGNTNATADGAGITIQDAQSASPSPLDATFQWKKAGSGTNDRWELSHILHVGTVVGNLVGNVTGNVTGNVSGTSATVTGAAQTAITSVGSLTGLDVNGAVTISDNLSLDGSNKELRFYEGSNYVGFEAPALTGNQIWALPNADGSSGQVLKTDGSGNLTFITLPTGDTYSTSVVSSSGIKLRLTGSTGSTDDIEFAGSGGVSIARTNDSKITITGANTYTLPCTTTSALGGIKIGYAESGKNYPVEVDSNCKAFVNVPWANTTYDLSVTEPSSGVIKLKLDASSGDDDEVTITGSTGITVARVGAEELSITNSAPNVTTNLSKTVSGDGFSIDSSDGTNVALTLADTNNWGLMSDEMFDKLDGISANANNSTNNVTTNLSTTTSTTSVTVNSSDGTNATINEASSTAAGVMSVAHHDKLDGISANANNSTNNVTTDISITQTASSDTVTVNSSDGTDGTISVANSTDGSNGNAGVMSRAQAHKLSNISASADVQTLTLKAPNASDSGVNLSAGATLILTGTGATTTSRNSGIVTINSTNTWNANTATVAGYVAAPGTNNANKVWKTSANGTPSWQADATIADTFRTIKVDTNHDGTANATLGATEELKLIPGTNISMAESGGSVTITSTAPDTTNWNFKTDDDVAVNISAGETIDYIGGNNITTSNTGNDITFDNDISNVYDGFFVQNSNGTSKFTHSASGINDDIILREGSNISITDGGDDIAIISATNTTYSAGTGLDLSGTTFSLATDQRRSSYAGDMYLGHAHATAKSYIKLHSAVASGDTGYIDFYTSATTSSNPTHEFRMANNGDFHADGDVIAFSSTTASDAKLKDNIQKVEGALELVSQLDGVTFNWKKDGKASAGVIAQNMEKVIPSAVKEVETLGTDETHKVVDYNQLSALFIEAIKELKEENKLLKTEIESLKDINKGKG